MVYKEVTFEEYNKATSFARFRYSFGVYIQIIAVILLILLLAYTVTNVEEMKANPIKYTESKLDVECIPIVKLGENYDYGSNRNTEDTRER